jgi:hypothetical protein
MSEVKVPLRRYIPWALLRSWLAACLKLPDCVITAREASTILKIRLRVLNENRPKELRAQITKEMSLIMEKSNQQSIKLIKLFQVQFDETW